MNPSSRRSVVRPLAAVAGIAMLALAGCATTSSATGADGAAGAATPSATPVSFTNCGVDVTIASPPERVVTIKSTSTEMLLALGLGDRIVGQAFPDGPVPDQWAEAAAGIPTLSDFMPSEDAVLDLEPDLVYAGWESAFAADAAGTRDELASLGVASYVQPAACRSTGAPDELDFDEVFAEITQVADIFDVDPTSLLASQQATLDAITPDTRGLSALWYSSGTDTPYVGAGTGAPQLVLDGVGLTNVAGDIAQTWTSLGWEAIVDADPDVIVLIDADWNTAQAKEDLLASNPATAQLTAVREHRYLYLPFASSEAGVRTVDAAASLAEQLAALDLP